MVQPYEHREAFVQSRTRRMPHRPDPGTYAALIAEARRVQKDGKSACIMCMRMCMRSSTVSTLHDSAP